MTFRVAIDFGTSSTCVVAAIGERQPQVVVIDGQPLMPSAVYAHSDGTLFVGQEAERQAAVDPARFEPTPKRRIDEGELLLGDTVLPVVDVVRTVLSRAVGEARRLAANADVDLLVLTHPADWGAVRTRLLRQAASGLGHEVALVPEPVAAAVFHAATYTPAKGENPEKTVAFTGTPGDTLAVLDFGGGTIDVSVVRRTESQQRRTAFEVLATRGDPGFGGADIDQALLEHVGSLVPAADREAWDELVQGRELADRRRRRVLRQDIRGAKETLSRHAYTDVPMPPPFADAHVTREQLEELIASPLGRAVELTLATIEDAKLRAKQLTAIFLVGGSSRIPMMSRLVHERTGVVPTTLDQPETVVARGALRAVQVIPDRGGAVPGALPGRGSETTTVVGRDEADRAVQGRPASGPVGSGQAGQVPRGAPGRQAGRSQGWHGGPNPQAPHPAGPNQQVGGQQGPQARSAANPSAAPGPNHQAPGRPQAYPPSGPLPHQQPSGQQPQPGGQHQQSAPYGPFGQQPSQGFGQQPGPQTADGGDGEGRPKRKRRGLVWSTAAVFTVLVAGAAGWFFFLRDDRPPGTEIARFSYSFVAPEGWEKVLEDTQRARVAFAPEGSDGSDRVVVQQIEQDFDAGEQHRQLYDTLRADADQANAQSPGKYRNFRQHHTYADKDTIYYEEFPSEGVVIKWYVQANGRAQVSIGCRVVEMKQRLESGCNQIVGTLEFTN
ncbi:MULTISPECIES: type VII secretion-associated protein [Prauserella salsuginis group]|uniref:Type VII secretion-associated protein n=1 Tax=Prauserella salsuginis TaxID=387889 RepID=A0ABW6G2I9_9PSEU|nr:MULTISPECIES: type VII secretion-associated protein [Prauserella salsuginis group]MCR3719806.1 type VII secretion-associated protein, Rv3446c family, C-terminal domain-containing protein [Prauserella flava]MCR3736651.1 type VII secretion-associated protein, Rv3446c family, C-terminal domain-containing protein [Prauserella salsuginis]